MRKHEAIAVAKRYRTDATWWPEAVVVRRGSRFDLCPDADTATRREEEVVWPMPACNGPRGAVATWERLA